MRWHDHDHEGRDPVIWLDGLDIPLVRNVEANWASAMDEWVKTTRHKVMYLDESRVD